MAAILSSISFWIWWRHQLSSQRVLCRPRFFCKLQVWLRSRLPQIFMLYMFFRVQLSCVFLVLMRDIMTGVLVGNDVKETQIQKLKRWQRKGILTKRLLENQRDQEKRSREPEVAALQNDTQTCYSI